MDRFQPATTYDGIGPPKFPASSYGSTILDARLGLQDLTVHKYPTAKNGINLRANITEHRPEDANLTQNLGLARME